MRLNHWIKLMVWIVSFQAIGFLLGLMTAANIQPWYNNLNKSFLTPPGYVFSMVWPLLYVLLALVAWMLSNQKKKCSKLIIYLYALQIFMNWAWTPLFFQFHWLKLSAVWLIVLTGLNLVLMIKAREKQKTIALLLAPYTLWLMFASYLNLFIALMN